MGARRPLTDLGMSLSLPYNHQADYLEVMAPFFAAAHDVYLAPPPDVAATLKPFHGDLAHYHLERARLRATLAPHGAELCYVLNAAHDPRTTARIVGFLEEELRQGGPTSVSVASFDLAVALHRALPALVIGTSLASNILRLDQARAWVEQAGARVIHPDKLLIRRPEALAAIKSLGVLVKLIINNRCAIGSPDCAAHAACALLGEGREQADQELSARCGERIRRQPWRTAPVTLPAAALPRLQGVVDIVKLDGRNWPTRQIAEDARDTLALASWAFYPYYLEPPDAFDVLARCDHRCDDCGWCPRHLHFYAPAAAAPPHLDRQGLSPVLPTERSGPDRAAGNRIARLFADAAAHGFSLLATRLTPDAATLEQEIRWRDGRVYVLRLARRSAEDGPCFVRTRTLAISYLFDEGQAPPGLLADLGRLCERVTARDDEAATEPAPPAAATWPTLDRLDVGGFCVQQCGFCREAGAGARGGPGLPDPRLVHPAESRALLDVLARSPLWQLGGSAPARLELAGEDPARRADLRDLVAAARRAGYAQVAVMGPATALAAPRWAARLAAAGLTHAAVTLLSDDEPAHDRLVGRPGAFAEARVAVRRLRAAGVALELATVTLAETLPRLAAMGRLLGAERLHLYLALHPGALAAEALAPLEALAPAVAACAAALRAAGRPVPELHLYSLPRCVADGVAARWPGRARYRDAQRPAHRAESAFAPQCAGCAARPLCLGVPAWHLARGDAALRPLARPPLAAPAGAPPAP